MRHYVAVQDGRGRWFYAHEGVDRQGNRGWAPSGACSPTQPCLTCDPFSFPVGQVISSVGCPDCHGAGRVAKPDACDGHATAAEAYEHEKQRLLGQINFHPSEARWPCSALHRCKAPGCGAWTAGSAWVGGCRHWTLCDAHQTRDVVEGLLQVGESWES